MLFLAGWPKLCIKRPNVVYRKTIFLNPKTLLGPKIASLKPKFAFSYLTHSFLAKDTNDIYGDDLDRIISTNRFVADKGFSGTEGGAQGAARSGPVQFERDEEDIFGLGQLLESGKESKKRTADGGGGESSSKKSRR